MVCSVQNFLHLPWPCPVPLGGALWSLCHNETFRGWEAFRAGESPEDRALSSVAVGKEKTGIAAFVVPVVR